MSSAGGLDAGFALLEACWRGPGGLSGAKAVGRLLDSGANPNICSLDGLTPLMVACLRGQQELAQQLCEPRRGAALDFQNYRGASALDCAILSGSAGCIDLLLSKGARRMGMDLGEALARVVCEPGQDRERCAEALLAAFPDQAAALDWGRALGKPGRGPTSWAFGLGSKLRSASGCPDPEASLGWLAMAAGHWKWASRQGLGLDAEELAKQVFGSPKPRSALELAASQGWAQAIGELLQSAAFGEGEKLLALKASIEARRPEACRALIGGGAPVGGQGSETPLGWALGAKNFAAMEMLLAAGADASALHRGQGLGEICKKLSASNQLKARMVLERHELGQAAGDGKALGPKVRI